MHYWPYFLITVTDKEISKTIPSSINALFNKKDMMKDYFKDELQNNRDEFSAYL